MTPQERRLWSRLRAGRVDGLKFRRQHVVGLYIADFNCHAARLVVEIDGARHEQRGDSDTRRDAWMRGQGLHVLRIPAFLVHREPDHVVDRVVRMARELMARRGDGEDG